MTPSDIPEEVLRFIAAHIDTVPPHGSVAVVVGVRAETLDRIRARRAPLCGRRYRPTHEGTPAIYIVRLLAFSLILAAIVSKNMGRGRN